MTTTSKAIPYEDHEVKGGTPTNNDNNNPSPAAAEAAAATATSTTGNENIDTNTGAGTCTGAGNTSSSFAHLALVPLHPACKNQLLESKQLPIVLGRTNLASWWWKSCPCQHYCRLHCRPVAQNIRSLSKVMIQLDTAGRAHIAGKNPHLVTITPERNDQPLQVNDILSIGRRDREPWMRFQVVPKTDNEPPVSQSKAKTHTPDWMVKQNKNKSSEYGHGRKNKLEAPAPPEWITTTRKRKSSRSSSCTNTKQQQQQQQQRPFVSNLLEAAAAASDNNPINNPDNSNNNNNSNNLEGSDTNFPHRKRRRRDNADKKARNRNATEPAAPAEKEHHLQVHLLFQDYETSANLVKASTQRKKKSFNRSNSNNKKEETDRTFVPDKSQVQLLSINFASTLLGQAKPSSQLSADAHSAPNPINGQQQSQHQSSSPSAESAPEVMVAQPQPHASQESANDRGVQSESQLNDEARYQDRQEDQPDMEDIPQSNSESRPLESSEQQQHQHLESSMLTMPECASESFQQPETMEPEVAKQKENSNDIDNFSSEASPPSCDPITDLGPWRQIVQREQGNFRHALASLIVCKNEQARQQADANDGLLWLPSLLEDDFYMEPPPANDNQTGGRP
jgi:hypothetical protein